MYRYSISTICTGVIPVNGSPWSSPQAWLEEGNLEEELFTGKHQEANQKRLQWRKGCLFPAPYPQEGIAGKLLGQWGKFAGGPPSLLVVLDGTRSSGLRKLLLVRMLWHWILMGREKTAIVCVGRIGVAILILIPPAKVVAYCVLPHVGLPQIQVQPNQKWKSV